MTYTAHEIYGGIYETYKRVEVTRRLRYMPYAQAGWDDYALVGERISAMYSYSSRIFKACYTKDGTLYAIDTRDAHAAINYSRTTSRQVSAAMQELGISGSEIVALKRFFTRGGKVACVGDDSWFNAETGEVIWEGVRG